MALPRKQHDYSEAMIIASLLFLTLWIRISTQMIIHTGVDERDYWYAAKALSQGLPYPRLTHRTVRWAIILPVAALQKLFGIHPNVYYVAPLLNALVQTFLLYRLGKSLGGRFAGVLSALMLIVFPYQIRAASQVRPEIFSITYMLLCACLLVPALNRDGRGRVRLIVASSLAMFLAYETKITNLFFLPGVFIALLLYGGKTRIRDCFTFGLPLLALFVAETAVYAAFTEFSFGQLSVITANHLSSDYADPLSSYWQVFLRYTPEYLQLYWQLPIAAFAAAGAYYLTRKKNHELKTLVIMGFSFIFCITFAVSHTDPIMVAEDFINRYFCALLPFAFIVIARVLRDAAAKLAPKALDRANSASALPYALSAGALSLAVSVLFSLPIVPDSAKEFAHSPLRPETHPFATTAGYYRELNNAWNAGVPVLSAEGNGGEDAAQTVCKYFLDLDAYNDGGAPEPARATENGTEVYIVSKDGGVQGETFIQAVRFPFRISTVPLSRISEIDSERSIQ